MTEDPIPLERIDSKRATFDGLFLLGCHNFTEQLLTELPELASLSVVPVWGKPGPELPTIYTRGRYGTLRDAGERLGLIKQLTEAHRIQTIHLAADYNNFDQLARQLAEDIRVKTTELEELTEKIRAKTAELGD